MKNLKVKYHIFIFVCLQRVSFAAPFAFSPLPNLLAATAPNTSTWLRSPALSSHPSESSLVDSPRFASLSL